jgi:hypothetical protein
VICGKDDVSEPEDYRGLRRAPKFMLSTTVISLEHGRR